MVAIGVVFAVIALRLVEVQAANRSHYVQLGVEQRVRTVTLTPDRGNIFDRKGADLALSVQLQSVWADPQVIEHPVEYAAALAPLVGEPELDLRARLSEKDKAFVYVARKVDPAVAEKVKALSLAGVGFTPESKRLYPAGDLAAPLLGFVGLDNDGLSGLEAGSEKALAGRPGTVVVERDPQGLDLPGTQRTVRATARGSDLVLTLDGSIQYEAERALVDQVTAAKAKGGMAVVADVRTGDILAMASVDGATDAAPAHPASAIEGNRPLTDVFEPGSTNKVVTIAAALEAGLVRPDTVLSVPQELKVYDTWYVDADSHAPELTVADILRESSNVGTIMIADKLGATRFDQAVRSFGFGRPTGLDFPGEAPGIILPLSKYNDTSLASMPIGNGIAVTAMQMLDVYLTLANDGVARTPRLVGATVDADGTRHAGTPGRDPPGRVRGDSAPRCARCWPASSRPARARRPRSPATRRRARPAPPASRRTRPPQVRRLVRRVRAGREPPPGGDRRARRARRPVLRRPGRRPRVLPDHAVRPARGGGARLVMAVTGSVALGARVIPSARGGAAPTSSLIVVL